MWPAFWLLSGMGNPEIDIMEILGNQPSVAYFTLQPPNQSYQAKTAAGAIDFSKDYHVFGCAWYADSIVMSVDSVITARFTKQANPNWAYWGTTATMNIILNLQIGGSWPGQPDEYHTVPRQLPG